MFGHSQSSLLQIVHNFTPACDVCVSHYTMVTLHRITWLRFVSPLLIITVVYREPVMLWQSQVHANPLRMMWQPFSPVTIVTHCSCSINASL